ncbi:hypothetical protein BA768_01120 [Chryseobacterium sp. CBo1]|uniref:toll/interleukin-1 receptor domain-containing protein n=1 Tax=Chryseobacterium sp. CBo1 TaxID=1869230 RepID=UPI000810B100|nr:TIR domain-containing protein [Chryseobacterium sp. CBo1]OCK53185.1 hypothetical protein BA768_01120 [Chryseobacterium sp. CBo1]
MNIFISWSGETSMKIASELKNFIPRILQSAKPYYTPSDIEKGTRWESEINQKLQECLVGLICLTPDNTEKPWIMFEAGALSNRLDKSKVCSILFDLKKSDVTGPLSRFQMTDFNSNDFYKLAQSINSSMGDMKIEENLLRESFDYFFPIFEGKVQEILKKRKGDYIKPQRSDRDILEELLDLIRKQSNKVPIENNSKTAGDITDDILRRIGKYESKMLYNYKVGDSVIYSGYGEGVVSEIQTLGDKVVVVVDFPKGDRKAYYTTDKHLNKL